MDIYRFILVIKKQVLWLLLLPVLAGATMYLLTMNQAQVYSTDATVFTAIASSSSLNDLGSSRVDFFATKTAYNNLISIINSRSVIEETALRLLALHLTIPNPDPAFLSVASYNALQDIIPDEIINLADTSDLERTYQNLSTYMQQDKDNFLYGLINFDHPHYSYKAISEIKTVQVGGSDIIQLSYQSDDPGVAYQTLNILIDVFLERNSKLKKNRTNEVIGYFEKQLQQSSEELNGAEDRLLDFNSTNSIVNYYEQTKHISSQQEKIEIKLQDVLLEFKASEAILSKLEAETQSRFNINLKTKEIIELRRNLIAINRQIAEMELSKSINSRNAGKGELLSKKQVFEHSLQNKLDSLYIYERHSDGIAIEKLLSDWLKNVIEYESAKARLLAMEAKNKEFKALYNQYAPLGATLKRIEREIDVKEKAYLEILHHLGLAKLKQQNEEMMTNMKLLDKPHLPIDPQPTKRKLLVLIMAIFTFIFTLLGIFLFELFDKTIKSGQRYAQMASIHVAGALPVVQTDTRQGSHKLSAKGIKAVAEIIMKHRTKLSGSKPLMVQFLSHWSEEGKSHVMEQIYVLLQWQGYTVLKTAIKTKDESLSSGSKSLPPFDTAQAIPGSSTLLTTGEHVSSDYDIILDEIPALSEHVINPLHLNSAALHFLVSDANRTWSSADGFIQSQLSQQFNIEPIGILNKTNPANMEEMVGDIPKKRSWIRKFIKQQIFKRLLS